MLTLFTLPNTYIHSVPNSVGLLYDRLNEGREITETEYEQIASTNELEDYGEDYNVFKPNDTEHLIIIRS